METHYIADIWTIACGILTYHHKVCLYCKSIYEYHFLKTTSNKKEVTCKNCMRTKVFKNAR